MPMPSDTTSRPDLMWMVAFHSALRRDLAHLARTASRHRSDDPARRTAVLTGWELFKTQLYLHHTGEDTDLWPGMRAHLSGRPDDLALLQAMEDEHGRIDPLVDSVDDALAAPDHGHEQLADAVDALTAELSGHLAHEEHDTLPLLERSLSQAEWQGFVTDQRRKSGIRGAAQFLPWLLDGTSAEQTQVVLAELPAPPRVVSPPTSPAPRPPPRPLGAINTGMNTGPRGQEQKRILGVQREAQSGRLNENHLISRVAQRQRRRCVQHVSDHTLRVP